MANLMCEQVSQSDHPVVSHSNDNDSLVDSSDAVTSSSYLGIGNNQEVSALFVSGKKVCPNDDTAASSSTSDADSNQEVSGSVIAGKKHPLDEDAAIDVKRIKTDETTLG